MAIIMPILTTGLIVTPNKLPNFTSDNDWIGFFGSYTGAIIGGLITLFIMSETIKNGDENLNKSIDENKKIQDMSNKVLFCNELATIISNYCFEYRKYRYCSIITQESSRDKLNALRTFQSAKYKLEDKKKDPVYLKNLNKGKETEELKEFNLESENYNILTEKFNSNLNKLESTNTLPLYFLLNIKLKNISDAEELKKKIEEVKKLSSINIDKDDINSSNKDFEKVIDELLSETSNFIDTYTKDK